MVVVDYLIQERLQQINTPFKGCRSLIDGHVFIIFDDYSNVTFNTNSTSQKISSTDNFWVLLNIFIYIGYYPILNKSYKAGFSFAIAKTDDVTEMWIKKENIIFQESRGHKIEDFPISQEIPAQFCFC